MERARGLPQGFTLLEVIVAFAIAALSLAALTEAVAGGLRSTRAAAAVEQAVSRAQSRLAAASLQPRPGERSGDDGGGFTWRELVRPLDRAGLGTLYEVSVEIRWTEGGPHRFRLATERLGPAAAGSP